MPQLAAVRGVVGRVDASLATSASAAGVPVRMVSELADLFGWEVDIQEDVHPGDEFRLLYAEVADDDGGSPLSVRVDRAAGEFVGLLQNSGPQQKPAALESLPFEQLLAGITGPR